MLMCLPIELSTNSVLHLSYATCNFIFPHLMLRNYVSIILVHSLSGGQRGKLRIDNLFLGWNFKESFILFFTVFCSCCLKAVASSVWEKKKTKKIVSLPSSVLVWRTRLLLQVTLARFNYRLSPT